MGLCHIRAKTLTHVIRSNTNHTEFLIAQSGFPACRATRVLSCYPGDVVEEGEGISWVTYTMKTAGPLTLEAIVPGESGARTFQAVCAPDIMSLGHSVLLSASAQATAGQPCSLIIEQHDR